MRAQRTQPGTGSDRPIDCRTPGHARLDAELLGALLQHGRHAAAAVRLGASLLERFGGLRALTAAPVSELSEVPGMNPRRIAAVRALPDLARGFFSEALPVGDEIRSPKDTEAFLLAKLSDRPHELFCCLYLDNRHRVIGFAELFRGTLDGTSVYPREVVKEALAANAAAVILAHNHPSGVAEPSEADESITRRLKAALELVDIRLLDHMIVGDCSAISLAGRGLL